MCVSTARPARRRSSASRGMRVEAARRAAVVRFVARTEPCRRQRLRRRDRHQQLLGAVAADRGACSGDRRGRRGAHLAMACARLQSTSNRRVVVCGSSIPPTSRCRRPRWRCLQTGDRSANGAGVVSTDLVVASSYRIRSSDRGELLMARAKKAAEAPHDHGILNIDQVVQPIAEVHSFVGPCRPCRLGPTVR